jgi:hypothetical protein
LKSSRARVARRRKKAPPAQTGGAIFSVAREG